MRIYISGISGTAMGPLALMALEAGFEVCGSDLAEGAVTRELLQEEIPMHFGTQDGAFLQQMVDNGGVDWFVYTSALPKDHAELKLAQSLGIRTSKRDELIAFLIDKLGLKMVAVAGTHGKTTTTSMIVWACLKLGIPVSYLVGTTLPFAESGKYDAQSKFLIYEADEYDRNFLRYSPWLSAITTVSYDHPDIYPTREDYVLAFKKFESQSEQVIKPTSFDFKVDDLFKLAGAARREDAGLALLAVEEIASELGMNVAREKIVAILNDFPGSGRRFERITEGVYSDYGHHPEEIAATVKVAQEEAQRLNLRGIVLVYEPHQNTRQHEVFGGYNKAFVGVDKLFWLPTYLTRENPDLAIITPDDFIKSLCNSEIGEAAETNDVLAHKLMDYRDDGYLILLMSAGPADAWYRKVFHAAGN